MVRAALLSALLIGGRHTSNRELTTLAKGTDMRPFEPFLLAGLLLAAAGCGDDPASSSPPAVAAVTATPARLELVVGDTARISAAPRTVTGAVIADAALSWESEAIGVASVAGGGHSGLITAHAPGSTRITASSAGKSAVVSVTVSPPPPAVATIAITPAGGRVQAGRQVVLTAGSTPPAHALLGGSRRPGSRHPPLRTPGRAAAGAAATGARG